MKKFAIAMACIMGLALIVTNAQATTTTLAYGDSFYLGLINSNTPSSPTDEVGYINFLNNLAAGATGGPALGQTYSRVDSTLTPAPPDISTPVPYQSSSVPGTGGFTAPFAGSFYLLAKYDATNAGALVWYVTAASGDVFYVPANSSPWALNPGGGGYGISHLDTFSNVPIPPTLLLMGSGLAGLIGIGRRRMKI